MRTMTTSTSRRSSSDAGHPRPDRQIRTLLTAGGPVHLVTSDRSDGDLHPGRVGRERLERRRRTLVDLPWTMLDQLHGTTVVRVRTPGEGDGRVGDVALLEASGAAVGVWAADCAPVVIVTSDGRVAAVHAGWRGLAAGILDVACDTLGVGAPGRSAVAVLGPCIRSCCNEFGRLDIEAVAMGGGVELDVVESVTRWGTRALDVPAVVVGALARHDVLVLDDRTCTRCDERWFSHRRGDAARHVVAVWRGR